MDERIKEHYKNMPENVFEGTGLPFYRCLLCGEVVSLWDIKAGAGCPKCGNRKITPTTLGLWEKVVQVFKHPKLWTWKDMQL